MYVYKKINIRQHNHHNYNNNKKNRKAVSTTTFRANDYKNYSSNYFFCL